MGAKKKGKKLKRPPRWWNAFLGWNPYKQGSGKGRCLGIRAAAGAISFYEEEKRRGVKFASGGKKGQ